jgi:hypothetical protein
MEKIIFFCLWFLLLFTLFAGAHPVDIIVMVDASLSMESCFDDLVSYLTRELLATNVRENDIFHLIQFSDIPTHELSQKIKNKDSLPSIIKEIIFLKEKIFLGRYTDIVKALETLSLFIAELPQVRRKKIFILTDGQHDPPESSPYSDRDPAMVKDALSRCTKVLREKNGWYVLSLQIPGDADKKKFFYTLDEKDSLSAPAGNSYPDSLSELIQILGTGMTGETKGIFPTHSPPVRHRSIIFIAMYVFIFFILGFSFLIAGKILVRKKKLEKNHMVHPGKWKEVLASLFMSNDTLIEMRVSFQNPHIGFRNIHKIKDNKGVSIGGGLSQFLIFLIPMPPHIAELYMENGNYIFNPVQKEFFPDCPGPVVNCLDKEIPVVSRHGYRTVITFREYISPLSRLHELLHSITYETENTLEMFHTHTYKLSHSPLS